MKLKKAYKVMKKQPPIEMPWEVMRFFTEGNRHISFCGDHASLGEDYGSIYELRHVVEWLAEQFNGKVTWKD